MIIEVAGVSTRNKGAELMLIAIADHYAAAGGMIELAVDPWFGTYRERAGYGLRTKLVPTKLGRSSLAMRLMPAPFRLSYGLAAECDISAVLDASGFAFGDQLGPERTEAFARDVRRWKGQGKKVVLLPQALGPFETPRVRRAFTEVLQLADLIYARDRVSYGHCSMLGGASRQLRLAPDFTNLVAGELSPGFEFPQRAAYIVPNHRMIEKTPGEIASRYVHLLADCVCELRNHGLSPCVLLHDSDVDESLVSPLAALVDGPLQVLRESDPRRLKGILGTAHVVVGSRFHALVGALSQSVPSLGIGWSHKYQMLFEDYDCAECLLSGAADLEQLQGALARIIGEPARSQTIQRLKRAADAQKQKTRELWSDVDALVGAPRLNSSGAGAGGLAARTVPAGDLEAV
jgi:Polysaccharide pyruvyl transferase